MQLATVTIWTYDEGPCGPTIENSLKYADKFVENWDTWNKERMMKRKQKRFREAQEAKQAITLSTCWKVKRNFRLHSSCECQMVTHVP